jgi:hypothetical protein
MYYFHHSVSQKGENISKVFFLRTPKFYKGPFHKKEKMNAPVIPPSSII